MHWNMQPYGLSFGNWQMMAYWLAPLMLWSIVWKGMVLWVTARRQQPLWFVLFLVLNTVGIAEIFYLVLTNGFEELRNSK